MPQDQKIVKDERGQEQPTDKKRAQQTDQQGEAGKPQAIARAREAGRDWRSVSIPSDNKNQLNRSRREPDPAAFSAKPELDENHQGGLRGQDNRQAAVEDASARGERNDQTLGEQPREHQGAQRGADVRAAFIKADDTLPEGLRRERTHALSPTEGRGDDPSHTPAAKN